MTRLEKLFVKYQDQNKDSDYALPESDEEWAMCWLQHLLNKREKWPLKDCICGVCGLLDEISKSNQEEPKGQIP